MEAGWRRLLKALGINDSAQAEDGPGDQDIIHDLASAAASNEAHVLGLVRRLVRLPQSPEDTDAVAELERLAEAAIKKVTRVGDLTVPKGHHGDRAINGWIAEMMGIYRAITGREPATSIGGPESDNKGEPGGPLIRLLAAAAKAVGIKDKGGLEFSPASWRKRVRTILAG